MAARDRWNYDVTCPKCGNSGTVHVSEDDHPWMRDPHFSVDEVPPGFQVLETGRNAMTTVIGCVACGVPTKG